MSVKYTSVPQSDSYLSLEMGSPFTYDTKQSIARKYHSIFKYNGEGDGVQVTHDTIEQTFLLKCLHVVFTFLSFVLVILTLPFSLVFCLKSIPEYEEVVVFRLGRMQKSKGHGLVFILPCIDSIHRVDMRMRSFSVPPQQVITQDGAIVEMGANIYFKIANVCQSVTKIQNLNYSSRILFQTCLTKLLARKNLSELDTDKAAICLELQNDANAGAASWGVEVTRVEIPQVKVLKEANPPRMGDMMCPPGMANPLPPAFKQLTEVFMAATGSGQSGHILQPGATISNKIQIIESPSLQENAAPSTPAELLSAVRRILTETLVKQVDAVFMFEVTGQGGGLFYLDLKHNAGSVGEGAPPGVDPDATLTLDIEDMMAMFSQQLNPLQAYMNGRLKVSGDLSAAMNLEQLLKKLNGKA